MGGKRVAVGKNDAFNELSSERLDRSGCIYLFFFNMKHMTVSVRVGSAGCAWLEGIYGGRRISVLISEIMRKIIVNPEH